MFDFYQRESKEPPAGIIYSFFQLIEKQIMNLAQIQPGFKRLTKPVKTRAAFMLTIRFCFV